MGYCTPAQCGEFSDPEVACAWEGPVTVTDYAPAPEPELALFWDANMFPNIYQNLSGAPPLTLAGGTVAGGITSVEMAEYGVIEGNWADDVDSFENAPGPCVPGPITTYYIVDGTADIPSDSRLRCGYV